MSYIIITGIYHTFTSLSYLLVGIFISLPLIILPILYPQYCDDLSLPFIQRYTTKATIYVSILVFILSYITAFMEAYTIQKFEYYVIPDRYAMYLYGSIFYAIYFWISFPMFYRLDERPNERWTVSKTMIDVFACCMIVTMI